MSIPDAPTTALAPDPRECEAGGILTIDLDAIVGNWRELARRAGRAECGAVVKADAYGCGLDRVAVALAKAGCRIFFVAHLAEARRLRACAREATIYVLNGLLPRTAPAYAAADLRPTIGSAVELEEWLDFCAATGWRGGAALHVDTGMNRLGIRLEEATEIPARTSLGQRGISLLMSHFACAEEPSHPLNAEQMAAFRDARALFPAIPGSLANSSGIFLGPDAHHDLVRPGIGLYGANPTPGRLNPMRRVVRLEGRVVQVRNVQAGETVGYGATWTAQRPARVAIVAVGYADGFLRAAGTSGLKPGAEAIVNGRRCPLAGRISMDLLAVDVSECSGAMPQRGDLVTLLGDEISVDDLAAHAGTISYEVLTNLGRRYRRVYSGG
jgi:alanine racemase